MAVNISLTVPGGQLDAAVQINLLELWSITSPLGLVRVTQIQNSADNIIPIPANATICIIEGDPSLSPLQGGNGSYLLKGAAPDVGIAFNATQPAIISVAGLTTIRINYTFPGSGNATFTFTFL